MTEYKRFFEPIVQVALEYEPPGSWMPVLPPGCIRLSAGYPFPESVPTAEIVQAARALVEDEADLPLHYLGSPSMAALAGQLRARCLARGISVDPDEILITAGAYQAMDLAARVLLGPESVVAVEAPTYMEALEVFRNYTSHIVGYPVDEEGLQLNVLADDLAARRAAGSPIPRLLYTISSFQNPTGVTLSLPRRYQLLELAEEYDFLILEDDAYGELSFDTPVPPLKSLDRKGRVIYLGSLSKVVATGLRIGWAVGASPLISAMSLFKKDLDHSFIWSLVSRYLTRIDLDSRVAQLQCQYRDRRDFMLTALQSCMPTWVTWAKPGGGYFIWLRVPGVDTASLLPRALAAGVAYVPGRHFYFNPDQGRDYLRLSYSYLSPERMEEGVTILGRLLARAR